jgi:hypothetical protein
MDSALIEDLLKARFRAKERLELLTAEASRLRLSGHQEDVRVHVQIGGRQSRPIEIAHIDRNHSYAAVQVRGMEMVMLGVKKWYAAAIDDAKERLANIETQIREAAK